MAERKFNGESSRILYKLATCGWRTTNDKDFIKLASNDNGDDETIKRNCYKVLTCDVSDEIIDLQSSLLVGIAVQVSLRQ